MLFSNYTPDNFQATFPPQENCTIYRKDRNTGDLITVFESTPDTRYYCNGARMSDNGNVIVAPPATIPSNPDGETVEIDGVFYLDFGDVVELTVKRINSNSQTDITKRLITNTRVGIGGGIDLYPGNAIKELSADGDIAILSTLTIVGETIGPVASLVDIDAATVHEDFIRDVDFGDDVGELFFVGELAISGDGDTLAYVVDHGFGLDANQDGSIVECNQYGRCDNLEWPFGPLPTEKEYRFYLIDRPTLVATELTELSYTQELIQFLNYSGPQLLTNSLSRDGNILSWIEAPPTCPQPLPGFEGFPVPLVFVSCGATQEPCVDEECEWTVHRYNITTEEREEQFTSGDVGTLPGGGPRASFSGNGRYLLYSRTIDNPFGANEEVIAANSNSFLDDYQDDPNFECGGYFNCQDVEIYADGYTCISRESIDSMSGVPVEEDCLPGGPIGGGGPILPGALELADFDAPVLWYLRSLNTGNTLLTSTASDELFQSSTAILSANGISMAYQSRDPRLRDDLDGIASLDESLLPEECFWNPEGSDRNLRVVTNDNVRYYASETQYVYETTPVFCPAPSPVVDGQVYANDVRVSTEPPVYVKSGSAFGWILLPLLGLGWWRRRLAV